MNSQAVVPDASVLLKWYLHVDEPFRYQAMLLYERFTRGEVLLFLPDVALYELGNRLLRLPNSGLEMFKDALDLLGETVSLGHDEMEKIAERVSGLHRRGLRNATFYDVAYIQVAHMGGIPLMTADMLQAEAAHSLGVETVLLKDYV